MGTAWIAVAVCIAGQGLPEPTLGACECADCAAAWMNSIVEEDCGGCDVGCGKCVEAAPRRRCKRSKCARCKTCIDGIDAGFNCHCQGSYNHPVPPLYTYHWMGVFKDHSVADFQSPWVRPDLRRARDVIPASHSMPTPTMRGPIWNGSGAQFRQGPARGRSISFGTDGGNAVRDIAPPRSKMSHAMKRVYR